MSYAAYADEWPMQMIRQRLDRSDRHLFTELLAHCTGHLTDGVIDVPLSMVTDHADPERGVCALIEAGLVDRIGGGDLVIVGYASHQRTREQVELDRERNRKRQEDYRERGRLHAEGDHRRCTKGCPDSGKDLRNALGNDSHNGTISSPLLSVGEGEEKSSGRRLKAAPGEPTLSLHPFALDDGGWCATCRLPEANGAHIAPTIDISAGRKAHVQ